MPDAAVDLDAEPDLSGLEPDPSTPAGVGDAIADLGQVPTTPTGPEGGI